MRSHKHYWSEIINSKGTAPKGGSTGEVLTKASDSDYDLEWAEGTGGGGDDGLPVGGTAGQVLKKIDSTDYNTEWDDESGGTITPTTGYSYFSIWAEENSTLSAGSEEWAFGNGANTPIEQGVIVPVDCELYAGSLSLGAGTATVGIYVNGTKRFDIVSGASASPNNSHSFLTTPYTVSAGDVIGFKTTAASGTALPCIVSALLRTEVAATLVVGADGADGTDGVDGYTPIKGVDYFDGVDGATGADGVDGYTPIKDVDYFDGVDGVDGYTPIKDVDYFDGADGVDGVDGYTPIKGVDYSDGVDGVDGYTPIKDVDYFDGTDGADGYTPIKDVDYFDGADGATGADGADGVGIPAGGTTDQVLIKTDGTDYNTEWADQSGGSGVTYDILGTVSQSSGVPTGDIFEADSNSNGEYVKMADGTMICTLEDNKVFHPNNSVGNIYHDASQVYTFPATFIAAPAVSGGADSPSRWIAVGAITTTTCTVDVLCGQALSADHYPALTAIGRWF